MPNLYLSEALEGFYARYLIRASTLTTPPIVTEAESSVRTPYVQGTLAQSCATVENPPTNINQEAQLGGVRIRTPTVTSEEGAADDEETDGGNSSQGQPLEGEETVLGSALKEMRKCRIAHERLIREEEKQRLGQAETIIQSGGGGGLPETPRITVGNFRPRREPPYPSSPQAEEGFGRINRESTRRDERDSDSSHSTLNRRGGGGGRESSEEEEEDTGFLRIRTRERNGNGREEGNNADRAESRAAKCFKTWKVRFTNNGDDPQEYLDDLYACIKGEGLHDRDVLNALYGTFTGEAKLWFRNEQHSIRTLDGFQAMFRKRFLKVATQERLEEDLKGRKQGKDEDIDTFISCIKRILSEFRKPPRAEKQIRMTFKNLKKEYRHYMLNKEICDLDDIVRYGREYEKLLEWDQEEQTPRPAERMIVKSAAYRPRRGAMKVAAAQEGGIRDTLSEEEEPRKTTKKTKKKSKEANEVAETTERMKTQMGGTKSSVEPQTQEKKTPLSLEELMKCLQDIGALSKVPESGRRTQVGQPII